MKPSPVLCASALALAALAISAEPAFAALGVQIDPITGEPGHPCLDAIDKQIPCGSAPKHGTNVYCVRRHDYQCVQRHNLRLTTHHRGQESGGIVAATSEKQYASTQQLRVHPLGSHP